MFKSCASFPSFRSIIFALFFPFSMPVEGAIVFTDPSSEEVKGPPGAEKR